jgi:hypothetical protein
MWLGLACSGSQHDNETQLEFMFAVWATDP